MHICNSSTVLLHNDKKETFRMVDEAMAKGINYYDTAWGYHGGNSETVMGEALAKYPRSSFFLATKFPGYDVSNMPKVKGTCCSSSHFTKPIMCCRQMRPVSGSSRCSSSSVSRICLKYAYPQSISLVYILHKTPCFSTN